MFYALFGEQVHTTYDLHFWQDKFEKRDQSTRVKETCPVIIFGNLGTTNTPAVCYPSVHN